MKAKITLPPIVTNVANRFLLTFKDHKNGAKGTRHNDWIDWIVKHPEERPVPAVKLSLKSKQP